MVTLNTKNNFFSYHMKFGHPPVTACEHVVVVYMSNFIETFL